MNDPLVILHEDAHCLAVVKPPGQFTQGNWAPPDEITLETAVRRYLDPANPSAVYLGIAHRLDRPTSGALDLGQNPQSRPAACVSVRAAQGFQRILGGRRVWAPAQADDETGRHDETWTDWLTRPDRSGVVTAALADTTGLVRPSPPCVLGRP